MAWVEGWYKRHLAWQYQVSSKLDNEFSTKELKRKREGIEEKKKKWKEKEEKKRDEEPMPMRFWLPNGKVLRTRSEVCLHSKR